MFIRGLLSVVLISSPFIEPLAAPPVTPTEPIHLLGGSSLEHFETWLVDSRREDPRNVFTVTNGLLRISGDGLGYLRTRDTFTNYTLSLEFRWGGTNHAWGDRIGKARDSGVFIHAIGPDGNSVDGNGAFMAAIECNVFQGAVGDFLLIRGKDAEGELISPKISAHVAVEKDVDGWYTWRPDGRVQTIETWGRLNWRNKDPAWKDVVDFRGDRDIEKPSGEWNHLEIHCNGDSISIDLNGIRVNEAFDVWPTSGHIVFQCEGSEIYYRNIVVSPLKTTP